MCTKTPTVRPSHAWGGRAGPSAASPCHRATGPRIATSTGAVALAVATLAVSACGEVVLEMPTVENGWLRGDLHGHTVHSDGDDTIAMTLAIADAWRAEEWLRRNPGFEEDHLHFYAVTDHHTRSGCEDPGFEHDYLIPICGKEWGDPIHACVWGVTEDIRHEPQGDETKVERVKASIAEAHSQGALFSPAHPMDNWLWSLPVEGFDAIEVWSALWSIARPESTEAQLDARVEQWGDENPAVRTAIEYKGGGNNAQALRWWQAWLSLGVHVPPVGGTDRHFVFPAGFPTTYVRAPSRDQEGVLQGIRNGETFISRSPVAPQIAMQARAGGELYPMGAELPSGATEVTVRWRVTRAEGGLLRLFEGVVDPAQPDPIETVIELKSADEQGTFTWKPPATGGWLHAVVVDPLPDPVPDWFEPVRDAVLAFPEGEAGEQVQAVAGIMSDLAGALDLDAILNPKLCDPSRWEPWKTWCMPADTENMGSVYVPVEVQPFLAVEFRDREPTGYAMGAISSAFITK